MEVILASMMTQLEIEMETLVQTSMMPIQEDAEVMTPKTSLLQENAVPVVVDPLDTMRKKKLLLTKNALMMIQLEISMVTLAQTIMTPIQEDVVSMTLMISSPPENAAFVVEEVLVSMMSLLMKDQTKQTEKKQENGIIQWVLYQLWPELLYKEDYQDKLTEENFQPQQEKHSLSNSTMRWTEPLRKTT